MGAFSRRGLLEGMASLAMLDSLGEAAARSDRGATAHRTRHSAHFVLVHGAFHGAWCWYKIAAALEAAGHAVTVVDLPSGGIDTAPAVTVTLGSQAERVLGVVDAAAGPVILVGHSAGGPVTVTPVAIGEAFASVRRFCVACRRDRAITFEFQRAMQAALPCERSFTIDSDHSPFLSRPAALLRILGAIARA